MKATLEHLMLMETRDEDGVHIWCAICNWDKNLGYMPSVKDAAAVGRAHIKERHADHQS